jgi:putative ABC transport system permease protein
MKAPEILAGSLNSLAAHPLRSLLTVLGVVTGVAAVIVVIAVGEGSRRTVLTQLELLGSQLLVVLPGPAGGGGRTDTLLRSDADAIEAEVSGVKTSPEVIARATARKGKNAVNVPVVGASSSFLSIRNFNIQSGRFITPGEDRGRTRVCVIGAKTASRLFPHGPAAGENLTLEGSRYKVIGVFEQKGDLGWLHPDEWVVIPLSTAQTRLLAIDYVHVIAVKCPSGDSMENISDRLVGLLRRKHKIDPRLGKDRLDFHIINQKEFIQAMSKVSKTLTALLVSLAAVALVTGGIGIMNIMLVSVTERTSEIGIRKAVGATGSDIFFQFLAESVMLSGGGALLGIGTGALVSRLLSGLENLAPVISGYGIIIGAAMAVMVGLVFGIYPALRAARMEPVEALRA